MYNVGIRLQTIKCLLIVPNAESALNEEAGMLLLEHYDQYCNRAKMYTDIHASGLLLNLNYCPLSFIINYESYQIIIHN